MNASDIAGNRLYNQQIAQSKFKKPADLVSFLGAVQAQDYAQAKWAIGLRVQGTSDIEIEKAFTTGTILRTHVLRPTWHFVASADIRWMLELTGPRVNALNAAWYKKLELTDAVLKRCKTVLTKELKNGKQLTRSELGDKLLQSGIESDNFRLALIMMHAELEGIICSGARKDKQFTYALFEERVPKTKKFMRDEALAELTLRYFKSRGPATLRDFVWWSGLTMADAKAGLASVQSKFVREIFEGNEYWLSPSLKTIKANPEGIHLLPNYDEYIVGYKDRSAVFDAKHLSKMDSRGNALFNNTIVIDGKIEGTWQRTIRKNEVAIEANHFTPLRKINRQAFENIMRRFACFLNCELKITNR